jgi:hypothetical protein
MDVDNDAERVPVDIRLRCVKEAIVAFEKRPG